VIRPFAGLVQDQVEKGSVQPTVWRHRGGTPGVGPGAGGAASEPYVQVSFPCVEGNEAFEHMEHMAHAKHGGTLAQRAALLVALLAAFLAISTLLANRAAETAILSQAQASDAYNEYQANSLKVHVNAEAAAMLRLLAPGASGAAAASKMAATLDKAAQDKYGPNKVVLLAKAQSLEAERDEAERRHKVLQLAEGAFQLAIVLTSAALLTKARALVAAGAALGVVGVVLLAVSHVAVVERLIG
jgi:Domain of unknown function (DUF4337)